MSRKARPGDIVKSLGQRYILTRDGKKISEDCTLLKCYPLIPGEPVYIGAVPIHKLNKSIHHPCSATFREWFKRNVLKC